ncbi:epididymal-specific lipocalin-8 isoform X1 [Homo sapiens]|uniref:epididymal-specific lipocalin-8 isoform X1 n=1 Tax=Homo sapiens TaxID=9606 RepID=UPI0000481593|nr:epididymal-specific lipocalin-8 isoform X1 [Homo sapiens]XP_054217956.1 epididymal-specific lipocalin-8 isoform X1 [Homo sapiens]|eukprot:XP_016869761.1 epididymal-specific lipocalin-8 isoform X1 [Homo sapiens]
MPGAAEALPTVTVTLVAGAVPPASGALTAHCIGGFWREVGVASDQSLVLTAPKRVEGLFLTLSGSNLTVKVAYNSSGSCEIEKIVGSEIDSTGKFAFPGHREIHVLDTDYEGYAILRVSLMWRGRNFRVLKYFTRSLEDKDRLGFWKFRELTADTGLYLAARPGRCAELLKEVSLTPDPGLC